MKWAGEEIGGFNESQIKKIILERMNFNMKHQLENLNLVGMNFKIDSYVDYLTNGWIYELKMNLLGEKDKKEVKIPSSWWQMFKQEYLPKWFLEKFPVQSKYIGLFEYCVLYPHLKISLPDERKYVSVMKFDLWDVEDNLKPDYKKLLV